MKITLTNRISKKSQNFAHHTREECPLLYKQSRKISFEYGTNEFRIRTLLAFETFPLREIEVTHIQVQGKSIPVKSLIK